MARWRFLSPEKQRDLITTWSETATSLRDFIESGHSLIHYQGTAAHFPKDIQMCVDKLYSAEDLVTILNNKENLDKFLPEIQDVNTQISRLVQEGKPAAFFKNQSTAVATLSLMLQASAKPIVDWLNSPNPSHKLRVTVDIGAPIGSGIRHNGEERITSCATMILQRGNNLINGEMYPFSLVTIYPDSDEKTQVGELAYAGRNHSQALVNAVNASEVGIRMYWGIKDAIAKGIIDDTFVSLRDNYNGKTAWIQTQIGVDRIAFGYNALSFTNGMLKIKDAIDGKFVSLTNCQTVSRPRGEISTDAREFEKNILIPIFQRAQDKSQPMITADSPLFKQSEKTLIREGGKDYEIECLNPCDQFDVDR